MAESALKSPSTKQPTPVNMFHCHEDNFLSEVLPQCSSVIECDERGVTAPRAVVLTGPKVRLQAGKTYIIDPIASQPKTAYRTAGGKRPVAERDDLKKAARVESVAVASSRVAFSAHSKLHRISQDLEAPSEVVPRHAGPSVVVSRSDRNWEEVKQVLQVDLPSFAPASAF